MQALAAGERIEGDAEGCGVSITMAETQLRRLFDKIEVGR
jgi:hypothetical protein